MVEKLNGLIGLLNRCGDVHWHFAAAMFLQVSILVGVLLCVDLCLRHKVRSVFRYWMWMLVVLKLVLPVTLGCPTSPAYWLADDRPADLRPHVGPGAPASTAPATATPVTPTGPIGRMPAGLSGGMPGVPQAMRARGGAGGATASSTMPASPVPQPPPGELLPVHNTAWLFLAWLATVTVLLGMLCQRTTKVRRLVNRAVQAPADLQRLLAECHALAQLKSPRAELKISDELASPAVCGLWRPTILLPRRLLDKLDRHQLRLVFVHELAHCKRWDLQVNCLQTVLQILYFYSPAVWIANAVLRRLREQAVDETVLAALGSRSERYPSTLLDIAAITLRPAESVLGLTGVVESRKAIAQRIRHIVGRRIPKSAKLGLAGFAAILLMGFVLLPMAASDRSRADTADRPAGSASAREGAADSEAPRDSTSQSETDPESASPSRGVLSGRITDETGAPVTDARIELADSRYRVRLQAKTDEQGHYHFDEITEPGDYQIRIESERSIGITQYRKLPRVRLTPESNLVRDFELHRACRIRIQTVDQGGTPVSRVRVYTALLTDDESGNTRSVSTDKQGWASVGGLRASETNYLFAASSQDHGFAKLVIKLDDPEKVVSRQIVLDEGVEVKGTALCSDGKPPAGWRIYAVPTWWHFGAWPQGQVIGPDGSFTLPHVVPGKYDLSILVPSGTTYAAKGVLTAAVLTELEGPLSVTLDHPSPGTMAAISGRIRYIGGPVQRGFWVFADSDDRQHHGSVHLKPGQEEFRIEPMPRGIYTLRFESTEIESKVLRGVTAPAENLDVEITVRGRLSLRGMVVRGDTKSPLTDFRVRVAKLRTLRGPNYAQEPDWHEFENPQGQFEVDVPGPGIYVVTVAAEGLAEARSGPINTDQDGDKPVRIELKEGVSLSGTVVDQEGNPVDGAKVIPLSKASGVMPSDASGTMSRDVPQSVLLRLFTTNDGAVQTVDGRFTIDHLTPGQETLKATHPDYCFAIVQNVEVGGKPRAGGPKITLTRGGTVRGRVYDEQGKPQANVTLYFQDDLGYSAFPDEQTGRFATAVTDDNGYYQARHLPQQLCYVHRAEEWNCWGVVRQTVLPQNGKTHALDFGGPAKLAGRLKVNGTPLANAKLQLSGENPDFGIFRAYARTTSDGSFAFRGVPPGQRTLHYAVEGRRNDWVRVRDLMVTSKAADLGTIEHVTGRIVVECEPAGGSEAENLRVALQEYDPTWTFGSSVGVLAPRENRTDPFVFDHVPPGKHELVCSLPNGLRLRQVVETTPAVLQRKLKLALPSGTASLSGKVDEAICAPGGCRSLKVWSKDKRLLTHIVPKDDGTYRLENIPAGDYFIAGWDTRDADALVELSLQDQEDKTLDLTPDVVSPLAMPGGLLVVRIFTPDGVPLPGCDVRLEGPGGRLSPRSSQDAKLTFAGDAGTYELSASYPSFRPIRRTVQMKPLGKDGAAAKDSEVRFHLQPSDG